MQTKEEKYNKRRVNTAYMTSAISITLVLFTLGFLGLLVIHAHTLSDYIKENIGFEIIMKPGVKEADIIHLQKNLDTKVYVKSTEYVTKKEAVKRLKDALGPDFVDFWGNNNNPLLPSIDVRFRAQWANNDSISEIKQDVLKNPFVKEVYYQKSLVEVINKNLNKIGFTLLGLSVLLLLISITLINNTIRLSIYSKRFIIKSMQLVGATEGFIRRPFVWKGVLYGVISAVISLLLLTGVMVVARENIPEIALIESDSLIAGLYLFIIIIGMAVSGFSTWFAVDRYLGMNTNNLVY
ncbi:MAG: cell division protein FtsX [Bacteroidales bacterium]|nr:cell division protein FtsX [Bacteroidales bacterium]